MLAECYPAGVYVQICAPFDEEQNEPELTALVTQANTASLQQDGKTVIKP